MQLRLSDQNSMPGIQQSFFDGDLALGVAQQVRVASFFVVALSLATLGCVSPRKHTPEHGLLTRIVVAEAAACPSLQRLCIPPSFSRGLLAEILCL